MPNATILGQLGVFVRRGFLSPESCRQIRNEMAEAARVPAEVRPSVDYTPDPDGQCGWPIFLEHPPLPGGPVAAALGIGDAAFYPRPRARPLPSPAAGGPPLLLDLSALRSGKLRRRHAAMCRTSATLP